MNSSMKDKLNTIIPMFFSFLASLIFMFFSPLNPWGGYAAGIDSSVFKTVSMMMDKGFVLYKDTFEHKGPVIYLINLLGSKISYYRGVWFFEVIFLAITVYFMYRSARLVVGWIESTIVTLASLSLLFMYFQGGNFTEEYAMPCISFSLFVFLDYLINNKLTALRTILAGIGLGIVLMLRPNMISVWMVFCICVLVKCLLEHEYKELIMILLKFMLGVFVVILPLIVWLALNDALAFFWHDYIIFNMQYVSEEGGRALFSLKLATFMYFFGAQIVMMSVLVLLFELKEKQNRMMNVTYLLYLIITLVMIAVGGIIYGHYGMILVPAAVYPLGLLFKRIESIRQEDVRKVVFMLVSLYFIAAVIMPDWLFAIETVAREYDKRDQTSIVLKYGAEISGTVEYVENNTDEDEAISVYGNWDIIYVLTRRKHATRYSYQFPIGEIAPEILDEYFEQLHNEQPNLIVISPEKLDDRMKEFLELNDYHLVCVVNEELESTPLIYSRE